MRNFADIILLCLRHWLSIRNSSYLLAIYWIIYWRYSASCYFQPESGSLSEWSNSHTLVSSSLLPKRSANCYGECWGWNFCWEGTVGELTVEWLLIEMMGLGMDLWRCWLLRVRGFRVGRLGWFFCSAKKQLLEVDNLTRPLFIAIINQMQRYDFELPATPNIKYWAWLAKIKTTTRRTPTLISFKLIIFPWIKIAFP